MERQTDIAMLAMGHPTALLALNHRRIASAVLEKDHLFATFECLSGLRQQQRREGAVHHLTVLQVFDVNNLYLRQFDAFITFLQRHHSVFPRLRIMIGFERWSRCAEKGLGAKHPSQHDGDRTGMITGRGILLLITRLVFLIDNHESQILERQQNGATGTEDDIIGIARELLLPDLHTFGIRILAVVDAESIAEHMLQALHDLHRESNLGEKIKHLFLLLQCLTDQMDIDLGLATGGDAVKQGDILLQERKLYLVISLLLGCAQLFDVLQMGLASMVQSPHLAFIGLQKPPFDKGCERCETMPLIEQFVTGNLNDILQLIPMGKRQVVDKSLQLFACPLEHIQGHMESLLVLELCRQANIEFGFRTVAVFGLQPSGKGSLIHFAKGRHIIIGYPMPQLQLAVEQDRRNVEHLKDILCLISIRCFVMDVGYNADVCLVPA